MYIIKVNDGTETLTYTFQDESSGSQGNSGRGITLFISAMKKQFKDYPLRAFMIIMNEYGSFYNHKTNLYQYNISKDDFELVLSEGRK